MKKLKYLLLICSISFLLTGCVKYNASMEIKKDKSMNFSIIYAIDTSISGEQQLLEDDDRNKLEDQGFTVTDYSDGNMKGFKISKSVQNIDAVSSDTNVEYSLSGILEDTVGDNYIFKVKKGFFKNTYTAKFVFDASDSELGESTDDSEDTTSDLELDSDEADNSSDFESESGTPNFDFSNLNSTMDLSFNVILPYSAKSNNATTVNNDNKNLTWNLSVTGSDAIEFEFELYNMTNVYACVGGALILVVLILISSVGNKKSTSTPQSANSQPQPSVENQSQSELNMNQATINQTQNVPSQEQPVMNTEPSGVQSVSAESPQYNAFDVQPMASGPIENPADPQYKSANSQPQPSIENQSQSDVNMNQATINQTQNVPSQEQPVMNTEPSGVQSVSAESPQYNAFDVQPMPSEPIENPADPQYNAQSQQITNPTDLQNNNGAL